MNAVYLGKPLAFRVRGVTVIESASSLKITKTLEYALMTRSPRITGSQEMSFSRRLAWYLARGKVCYTAYLTLTPWTWTRRHLLVPPLLQIGV